MRYPAASEIVSLVSCRYGPLYLHLQLWVFHHELYYILSAGPQSPVTRICSVSRLGISCDGNRFGRTRQTIQCSSCNFWLSCFISSFLALSKHRTSNMTTTVKKPVKRPLNHNPLLLNLLLFGSNQPRNVSVDADPTSTYSSSVSRDPQNLGFSKPQPRKKNKSPR